MPLSKILTSNLHSSEYTHTHTHVYLHSQFLIYYLILAYPIFFEVLLLIALPKLLTKRLLDSFFFFNSRNIKKYGTLNEFACHPCAEAMLIFSVSFQF